MGEKWAVMMSVFSTLNRTVVSLLLGMRVWCSVVQ